MEINFYFQIAVIIVSIVFHELSHGYAAYFLGDPTAKYAGRLTLNPIKHLEIFGSVIVPIITFMMGGIVFGWAKPVPYNPYNLKIPKYGEVIVALAGPISNFLIAFVFAIYFRSLGDGVLSPNGQLALLIITVNLTLAVFNMIPIPPLDGYKVFFGLLPYKMRFIKEFVEKNILLFVILFIFSFSYFLDPFVFWLIKIFIGQ